MRILFVVPYTPNLIRVRPYQLIRGLAARGHQVTVATVSVDAAELADAQALAAVCHQVVARPLQRWRSLGNCLAAVPGGAPLQSVYSWHAGLAAWLAAATRQADGRPPFDVVHVEHLRGARYGLHLKRSLAGRAGAPPIVWDSVDCISSLFERAAAESESRFGRWVTRFELRRTRRYEGWLAGQFSRVLVTSSADREALAGLVPASAPAAPIAVLPNGVDLAYFRPAPDMAREPATLVVSGKMSYHANVTMVLHLAQRIMPRIWAQRPDARLTVVGKDPPAEIRQLANNPAITVTGTVDDVRPYLQAAAVAVAPLTYGAGIQNKILEAMACATPVVTTPQGAGGLGLNGEEALWVGQGDEDYAARVLTLLERPGLREALGRSGRAYVEAHHSWDAIAARLEDIYRAVPA